MEALIGHGNIERLRHRRFLEVRMIALWRLGSWLMVRRRRLPVRNRFRVSDRDDNLPDGGTAGEPCQGVPAFGQCINPVDARPNEPLLPPAERSEEHTSELQSLMRISYAVFCLKKKNIILHTIS